MKKNKKVKAQNGRLIIALGEHTGHNHSFADEGGIAVYENETDGGYIVDASKEAPLSHQEHKPITLTPNKWETGIVQEYDYLSKMQRKVVD